MTFNLGVRHQRAPGWKTDCASLPDASFKLVHTIKLKNHMFKVSCSCHSCGSCLFADSECENTDFVELLRLGCRQQVAATMNKQRMFPYFLFADPIRLVGTTSALYEHFAKRFLVRPSAWNYYTAGA